MWIWMGWEEGRGRWEERLCGSGRRGRCRGLGVGSWGLVCGNVKKVGGGGKGEKERGMGGWRGST